jgi:hypothetical protein
VCLRKGESAMRKGPFSKCRKNRVWLGSVVVVVWQIVVWQIKVIFALF